MQKAEFLQNVVKEFKRNSEQRLLAVANVFHSVKDRIWEEMQKEARIGESSYILWFNDTTFHRPEEFGRDEFFSHIYKYVVDELLPLGYTITEFWTEDDHGERYLDYVQISW